jgi:hypothetical protein
MLRLSWSLPVLAACLALSATAVRAQSATAPDLQTVTGSGYQYQVPASWQTVPAATFSQQQGDQSVTDDGAVMSQDTNLRVHVETASGYGLTAARLTDVLGAFLGIGLGGNNAGLPPVSALTGPDSAQIANADSAMSGAIQYTDPSGAQRVIAAKIALRGDTSYMLVLDVSPDFYHDPMYATVMNSFQLTNP